MDVPTFSWVLSNVFVVTSNGQNQEQVLNLEKLVEERSYREFHDV